MHATRAIGEAFPTTARVRQQLTQIHGRRPQRHAQDHHPNVWRARSPRLLPGWRASGTSWTPATGPVRIQPRLGPPLSPRRRAERPPDRIVRRGRPPRRRRWSRTRERGGSTPSAAHAPTSAAMSSGEPRIAYPSPCVESEIDPHPGGQFRHRSPGGICGRADRRDPLGVGGRTGGARVVAVRERPGAAERRLGAATDEDRQAGPCAGSGPNTKSVSGWNRPSNGSVEPDHR